jgi:hypothetical protein
VLSAYYAGGKAGKRTDFVEHMPHFIKIGERYAFLLRRAGAAYFLQDGSFDLLRPTLSGTLKSHDGAEMSLAALTQECP